MKIIDINSKPRSKGIVQREINIDQQKIALSIKSKQRRIYIIGFLTIAIVALTAGWNDYQAKKDLEAQNAIFQAIYYFGASDFDKALEGDGVNKGFLEVIRQYPYTKTANLAHFYVGTSYMHQKAYDKTISFLSKFHAKDFIVQARAWCVIGDAYSAQKHYKKAAAYYMKAAHYKENSVYTPGYLAKAAVAFEADGQYKDAYDCYQEIMKKYPRSQYGRKWATKEASRLSALL